MLAPSLIVCMIYILNQLYIYAYAHKIIRRSKLNVLYYMQLHVYGAALQEYMSMSDDQLMINMEVTRMCAWYVRI